MGSYKYLNTKIEIAEDRLKYNEMRQLFNKLAIEAQSEFRKMYSQNKDMDSVIRNVAEQGATIFISVLTKNVMPMIVGMGVYNIDEETFLKEYYFTLNNNYTFDDAVFKLSDAYFEIVMDKATLDAYRVARRESRGRFVGGGFGVSGAAKGILLAGAGNMITGGLHRVANGVGGMISSIKTEGKKLKLFNNPEVLDTLCIELYASVFRLHLAYYNFLIDNFEAVDMRPVTTSESQQAIAILKNVQSNRVEEDKVPYLLAEAIQLDPYKFDIYKELIIRYGDNDLGLAELGQLFGFDAVSFKESLLDAFSRECSIITKQLALKSRYEFKKYQEYLGVEKHEFLDGIDKVINDFNLKEIESSTNFSSKVEVKKSLERINEECKIETEYKIQLIEKLNRRLNELELESRTLDGIVYSSEDQANKARREKDQLLKIELDTDFDCTVSLLNAKKEVDAIPGINATYKQYLENRISDRLSKIELKSRSFESIVYSSVEEAEKAKLEKEELVNSCALIDYENETQLLDFIETLENQLQEGVYTTKSATDYIKKKIKETSKVVKNKRTVEGVVYNSFEEAKEARQIADKIKQRIEAGKDDFNILISLKNEELDCADERLAKVFLKKIEQIVNEQIKNDESVVSAYQNLEDELARVTKSLFMGIGFFVALLLIFSATWIKLISILGIIGSFMNFVDEKKKKTHEKRAKKDDVLEARKRLQLLRK